MLTIASQARTVEILRYCQRITRPRIVHRKVSIDRLIAKRAKEYDPIVPSETDRITYGI